MGHRGRGASGRTGPTWSDPRRTLLLRAASGTIGEIVRRIARILPLLAAALLLPLAAACADRPLELRWSASLTSVETSLSRVGPGDRVVYGWNRLAGETVIDGGRVTVEMLGNVAYRSGDGPFFGFITLTFADGSTLGLRMEGETDAIQDTSRADFRAKLTVLGGTGRYLNATGSGRWQGHRDAQLGGAVEMEARLRLRNVD